MTSLETNSNSNKLKIQHTMKHHIPLDRALKPIMTPIELFAALPAFKSSSARAFIAFLLMTSLTTIHAQSASNEASSGDDFFSKWFGMVSKAQAEQPHWMTPVVTVTPRLEQEYRYDQSIQGTAGGNTLTSYGGGKGLEIIPLENVEVILGVPAWQSHKKPSDMDGWADDSFLVKYRWLCANEEHGDYIITTFLGLTAPTGDAANTKGRYTFTPTVAGGKGWGDFDIQSTLGISLPTDHGTDPTGPGTPIALNTALQYKLGKVVWPEIEANYTYYPNGEHEGKEQLFLTPGVIFGRFPLWQRLAMSVGLGYQVAVTSKPTYGNNFILTARLPF
jgi:hypothetical protein